MTARVGKGAVLALYGTTSEAAVSKGAVLVLRSKSVAVPRVNKGAVLALIGDPPEIHTRITQQPILVLDKSPQVVRVTQQPVLMLNLPVQGAFITQAPQLVLYTPKPVPVPGPVIPDEPVIERWEWLTAITVAESSREQRSALRKDPRVHVSFSIIIEDDDDRYDLFYYVMKNLTRTFSYPMYQHWAKLDQAAAAGTNKLYFDNAAADVREGESLALFDPHTENTYTYTVSTVDLDGATTVEPLEIDAEAYFLVCPAPEFRLPPVVGIQMDSVSGVLSLELHGVQPRKVLRPNQSTDLTLVDGMLVLDKRPLANESITDNITQNVDWLDNGTTRPEPKYYWRVPLISSSRQYLVRRPQDLDYWRAVGDYLKGRQKPFLLPTFRNDIKLSSVPALGATVLVSSTIQIFFYWRSTAYDYILIDSAAGKVVRKILEVTLNYNSDGEPESANLKLDGSIGSTPGSNDIRTISFTNTVRLDSDEIVIEHGPYDSLLRIVVKGVDQ